MADLGNNMNVEASKRSRKPPSRLTYNKESSKNTTSHKGRSPSRAYSRRPYRRERSMNRNSGHQLRSLSPPQMKKYYNEKYTRKNTLNIHAHLKNIEGKIAAAKSEKERKLLLAQKKATDKLRKAEEQLIAAQAKKHKKEQNNAARAERATRRGRPTNATATTAANVTMRNNVNNAYTKVANARAELNDLEKMFTDLQMGRNINTTGNLFKSLKLGGSKTRKMKKH